MKLTHLQIIAEYLNQFDYITKARRVGDNTIELALMGQELRKPASLHSKVCADSSWQNKNSTSTKNSSLFFDLTRGHSTIYIAPSQQPQRGYNAPFDILLQSLVAKAKLIKVEMPLNDRILRFHLAHRSSYKNHEVVLQLEFTGRNTNAILLDENNIVKEALRHIDSTKSYRVIQPGVELANLPERELVSDDLLSNGETSAAIGKILLDASCQNKVQGNLQSSAKFAPNDFEVPDDNGSAFQRTEELLIENYRKLYTKKLSQSKKNKITATKKKIVKFEHLLNKLSNPNKLIEQSQKYQNIANILLANLHNIKPYDKVLEVEDFEGNLIKIDIPPKISVKRLGEYYFNLSKRARAKAQNLHIERENLESKKVFYENILYAIENSTELHELDLLVPRRAKAQRKKEKIKEGELFWIEDFKVIVGRNSTENQHLLHIAKANDLWMHIRDIPSSHVLIKTDKQNLPESVILDAAKLCVDFSIKNPGDYDVDYTRRKFVKIQEGSCVEYDKYKTVRVRKKRVDILL